MPEGTPEQQAEFDAYAADYSAGMDVGVKRCLGADAESFLEVKVEWLRRLGPPPVVQCVPRSPPSRLWMRRGHVFARLVQDGFPGAVRRMRRVGGNAQGSLQAVAAGGTAAVQLDRRRPRLPSRTNRSTSSCSAP